jgi:putative hydrolase of the HAD superfamily
MALDGSYSTVLFDVGWTLAYPSPRREEAISDALKRLGYHVSPSSLQEGLIAARAFYLDQRWRPRPEKDLNAFWIRYYAELLAPIKPPVGNPALAETLAVAVEEAIEYHLYPDTLDTLRRLQQRHFIIGAVSNWSPRLPVLCDAWGLTPYFETLVVSDIVGLHKPDPRIFYIALEALGASAAKTVYVGNDYKDDVQGARAAGITPILLDRMGQHDVPDCLCIHSLEELSKLLGNPCSAC